MDYFRSHAKQDLHHAPVVDWVEEQYLSLYGEKPRDPWRAIRKLSQEGKLVKVAKGIYRYDPEAEHDVELFDFPPDIKRQIFERDSFRCVVCGQGREDGVEIVADHKVSKDKGGSNLVSNGQTLCTPHNLLKKNYSRTEAGKRYFIQFYEDALRQNDKRIIDFCEDVFAVYDKHHINGHIKTLGFKLLP
jgi:hypothetical protein